jgi:protocatechuate 3,4-dioxygenase beta subunit
MAVSDRISRRSALRAGLTALALAPFTRALADTPAQDEGPFYPVHKQADTDLDMTRVAGRKGRAQGEVVEVSGRVVDEAGTPIAGALVDIWQANAKGRYAHEADPNPAPLDPDFQGWARLVTDREGRYRVRTIIPGAYPVEEGWQRPPHIHFKVARRGFRELTTQMYFDGHPLNAPDRILNDVPEAQRGQLVVAFTAKLGDADRARHGRFDLVMKRV